jgi:hypothetical protein
VAWITGKRDVLFPVQGRGEPPDFVNFIQFALVGDIYAFQLITPLTGILNVWS